jgi:hypothetical protein
VVAAVIAELNKAAADAGPPPAADGSGGFITFNDFCVGLARGFPLPRPPAPMPRGPR